MARGPSPRPGRRPGRGPAPTASAAAWVAALLLAAAARPASAFTLPCSNVAKRPGTTIAITGCVECISTDKSCQLCHHSTVAKWNTIGKIIECAMTATEGTASRTASGDPNCMRADGPWCVTCKAGFFLNKNNNYLCERKADVTARCRDTSGNPGCAQCNPDGTCKKCTTATQLVVPKSAIYINVPGHESECRSMASVKAEAEAITGVVPWTVDANCREVTPDFKCARCVDGFNLAAVDNKCYLIGNALKGSGCTLMPAGVNGYREYCMKCDASKAKCRTCTWGRWPDAAGQCSINCKQLFGIGCKGPCTPGQPITVGADKTAFPGKNSARGSCGSGGIDTKYAQGRR